MLTLLTGTDTHRKKKYLEKEILSFLAEGKKVYLVVPEQSAFNRDRDLLFEFGERDSDALCVTGLERFVCEMLEENGLQRKPSAENAARAVVMSMAAESVKDSLDIFARHGARPSTVNELLSTYDELKQAGASAEALGGVRAEGAGKKARELSLIFAAYDALINERFSDPSDNISRLCGFLAGKRMLKNCVLFFDDFRGFTGVQTRLISLLCADADSVFLSVPVPVLNDADGNEAFGHARRNARAVRTGASKYGVVCREINTDGEKDEKDVFAFLRNGLFSAEDGSFGKGGENICVYEAADTADECSFAAMCIKKLIESGKYRCRDIGVFQRSDIYTDTLITELKKCGIPVCEDARKALGEFPLVRMVLCGVEAAVRGLNTQRILTYLKTGVAGITEDECDLLENYVTLWSIDGKAWESDFNGNPEGYGVEFDGERRAELEKINSIRKKAAEPILKLKKELGKGEPYSSCAAVYGLISDTGAKGEFLRLAVELNGAGREKEAMACSRVWNETADALDALYNALGDAPVSPQRFYELLTLILCGDSLGEIPAGIDCIVIGTADRTRFLEPKAVFVVGLTEGDFPQNSVRGGVFSAAEKRELVADGIDIESTPEKIYGEERLIAYNAVTAASDRLFLSYPRISASGEEKEKSEVINEIEKRVPQCKKINAGKLTYADRVFSPSAGLDMYASHVGENSVFMKSLRDALTGIPGFSEKADAVDYAYGGVPASFSDKSLARGLFGEKLYISPSRLEAYSKCPFMYFCRYGMKVKTQRTASLDARINGLLVHRVFEVLLGRYSKDELSAMTYEKRKAAVDETADEYIRMNMGGADVLGADIRRQLERQKRTLLDILNRLIAEFGNSSFEVSDAELEIKRGSDAEPFTVTDGEIEVTLHGTVDRVDTFRDGDVLYLRVIDYKTGGRKFLLGDVFDGLNMQMLVYLIALWVNGKGKYADAVPAGILYVPARSGGANVGRHADRDEIEAQKLKNGRMNGIILENESVLRGMERDAEGIFIEHSIKDGKMKGEFYTLDDMERIKKKIEKVILDETRRMLDGDIPAVPVVDGDYEHTCEYCEFSAVCRRESDGAKQDYVKMKHADAIKALREEENI